MRYELKKEGLLGGAFLDESEMELSLNEYGKAGWELVSLLETVDGLVGIFKQPLGVGIDADFTAKASGLSTAASVSDEPGKGEWKTREEVYSRENSEVTDNLKSEQPDVGTIRIE